MNTIGERIKYLRISQKMTIQILADAIGKSVGNISDYENNKHEPSAQVIIKLSKLFDVSTDWILYGEEFKNTDTDKYINIKATMDEFNLISQFRILSKKHKFDTFAFACFIHSFNIEVAYYKGIIIAIDPSIKEKPKD